jgi:hypothetical protein
MYSITGDEQEREQRPRDPGSIWQGIALGGTWNICALGIGILTILIAIGAVVIAGFGIVQYAWISPLYLRYKRRGETETAKGILIASGITVLLSAACWGAIYR